MTAAQQMILAAFCLLLGLAQARDCRSLSIGSYNDIQFARDKLVQAAGSNDDTKLMQTCFTKCKEALKGFCDSEALSGPLAHAIEHYNASPDPCAVQPKAGVCLYLNGVSFDGLRCGCPMAILLPPLFRDSPPTAKGSTSQVDCKFLTLTQRVNQFFKEDGFSVQPTDLDDANEKISCDKSAEQQCQEVSGVLFD